MINVVPLLSLCLFAFLLPAHANDWPSFRGPDHNGVSRETGWTANWPLEGPKQLWKAKVGTGFDHKLLQSLYARFQKLTRPHCAFANLPEKRGTSGGLTAGEMTRCTWVEPKLVCQIAFTEWTRDGHLRHPAFLGLREDKKPQEVIRESAEH